MRFTIRAVGVRDDIPLPGAIYAFTASFIEPFYRFFPSENARFDYPALEIASLAAAATIIALALMVYAISLLARQGS